MLTHIEADQRHGQDEPDPEPAGHVRELGVRLAAYGGGERLQRHSADWTVAGRGLADLGMHRTGIDRAGGSYRLYVGCRRLFERCRGISLRVGGEALFALRRTEGKGLPGVVGPMLLRRRIDRHA